MKKIFLGLIAVAIVVGGLWLGFGRDRPTQAGIRQPFAPPTAELPAPLPPLSPGETVAFLELGSEGCKPCEAMKPVMQAVRETFPEQVEVTFYDVRKVPARAGEYSVRLIPTQVFLLPDGTEFFRHEGYFSEPEVMAVLARMGAR